MGSLKGIRKTPHWLGLFAGYPQTKCQYDQRDSARELIAVRNCAICMVHFHADSCCGAAKFPYWHGELVKHMEDPRRQSSLVSFTMPGTDNCAYHMWLKWQVQDTPFIGWLERKLTPLSM